MLVNVSNRAPLQKSRKSVLDNNDKFFAFRFAQILYFVLPVSKHMQNVQKISYTVAGAAFQLAERSAVEIVP